MVLHPWVKIDDAGDDGDELGDALNFWNVTGCPAHIMFLAMDNCPIRESEIIEVLFDQDTIAVWATEHGSDKQMHF